MGKLSHLKKALDMSKAARMKRAAEQGFDTGRRMFHGTADDVAQFSPLHYGRSTGAKSARQGTWLVDDGKTARGYADYAAMDAKVKKLVDKSQRLERQGKWDAANDAIVEAERLESEFYNNRLQGQSIMPLYAKGKYLEKDFGGAEFVDVEDEIHDLIKQAKREGYDGLRAHNLADDVALNGRPATHQLVFDPQNIRSENAAFDPANIGNSDLLGQATPGGMTAAGSLAAVEFARRRLEKSQTWKDIQGIGETAITVGSGIIGGMIGDLSRLGGYLNPFMSVEDTERGAEALSGALQYQPSDNANPYLDKLSRGVEQAQEEAEWAADRLGLEHSIPNKIYESLPERAQGIVRSAGDILL